MRLKIQKQKWENLFLIILNKISPVGFVAYIHSHHVAYWESWGFSLVRVLAHLQLYQWGCFNIVQNNAIHVTFRAAIEVLDILSSQYLLSFHNRTKSRDFQTFLGMEIIKFLGKKNLKIWSSLKCFLWPIQSTTMVCVYSFWHWTADHDCVSSWGSFSTKSHSFSHCEQGPWLESIFCNAFRIPGLPK